MRDFIQHFSHKRADEQLTRFLFVYAALLHVEEGRFVELTGGGAVRRLYIIGVDLQLRLV